MSSTVPVRLYSEEVLEWFRTKVTSIDPEVWPEYKIYGITHLDIHVRDGSVKQIVLLIERRRIDECPKFLNKSEIYADIYIEINDETLIDVATKEIPLDKALSEKLIKVRGDEELWKYQLELLKELLPKENFAPKQLDPEPEIETEIIEAECSVEPPEETLKTDWSNLPQSNYDNCPKEFKALVDALLELRNKEYVSADPYYQKLLKSNDTKQYYNFK